MHLVGNLRCHVSPVTAVECIGSILYSGDEQGNIVEWNLDFKRPIHMWKAHNATILQIKHSILLYTQGRDETIRVWNQYNQIKVISVDSLHFCHFQLQNDQLLFIEPKQLQICQLDTKTWSFRDVDQMENKGTCLCLEWYQENEIIMGFEDGSVLLGSKEISKHKEPVLTLCVYQGWIVSGGADCIIKAFHPTLMESKEICLNSGISVVYPWNDVLLVGLWDATILYIQDWKDNSIQHHRDGICSITNNSTFAFVGSKDSLISIWKL